MRASQWWADLAAEALYVADEEALPKAIEADTRLTVVSAVWFRDTIRELQVALEDKSRTTAAEEARHRCMCSHRLGSHPDGGPCVAIAWEGAYSKRCECEQFMPDPEEEG